MAFISSGRPGDQVTLTSVLREFEEPVVLKLDYLLEESKPGTGGTLSVYLVSKHRVPMRLHLKEGTTAVLSGGWKRGCVYIPRGTYRVMFLGTLGRTYESDIYLDNIAFHHSYDRHDDVCHEDIIKPPTGNIIFLLGERVNYFLRVTHS